MACGVLLHAMPGRVSPVGRVRRVPAEDRIPVEAMNRRSFFGALAKGVAAAVGGAKALPRLLLQVEPGVIGYKANTIGVIPVHWRVVPSSEIYIYTDSNTARFLRDKHCMRLMLPNVGLTDRPDESRKETTR